MSLFIYPTGFWFIAAVLELYLLFYLIEKSGVSLNQTVLFLTIVYCFKYITAYESCFFVEERLRVNAGLMAMIIGAILRSKEDRFKLDSWKLASLSIISLIGFLSVKLMIQKFEEAYLVQFLTHVFSIGFAFFTLLFMKTNENRFKQFDKLVIGRVIVKLSACSLEIYMIQRYIIDRVSTVAFPANLILILLLVFAAGIVLHEISGWIIKIITRMARKTRG